MPRAKYQQDMIRHQVSLPKELDIRVMKHCNDNNLELRQVVTMLLIDYVNGLESIAS